MQAIASDAVKFKQEYLLPGNCQTRLLPIQESYIARNQNTLQFD